MGCHDSIVVKCPDCKMSIEFHSKAGECGMKRFLVPQERVPLLVARDLWNAVETCKNCGTMVRLDGDAMAIPTDVAVTVNRFEPGGTDVGMGLCDRCGMNYAQEPHACPYEKEIGNEDEECTCCEECTDNCAMSI